MTSFKSRDDVLTMLIHLGYLAYDADSREAYVPNEEVRTAFARAVDDTDWTPVIQAIRSSDKLLKALKNYEGKLLLVGVSYDKESKEHSCVIEEWKK